MKRLLQAGVCASQENPRVGRCQNVEWSGLCLVDQRITSLLAPCFLQDHTSALRAIGVVSASYETALPRFPPFALDVVVPWPAVGRGEAADGRQIGWCPRLFTSMVRSFAGNLLYILRRCLSNTTTEAGSRTLVTSWQSAALEAPSDSSRSTPSEQTTDFRRIRVS
jgi:hypothetical protein